MASQALVESVRESFGRVVYTHKTHEKQIEILSGALKRARWLETILISVTASGAISVLLGSGFYFQLGTAIVSLLATAVTISQLSFSPERQIADHRRCSRALWSVRERYINLLADAADGSVGDAEIRRIRDDLVQEVHKIYLDAPDTTTNAYKQAQVALKINEEMTFADHEIDAFLPDSLKVGQSKSRPRS